MMEKKKSRRSKTKYPALHPELNLKIRYEEIEDLASYAAKLPPKEREWLNRFSEEYICANFNHGGEVLHKDPKLRTKVYNKAWKNREDLFTKMKAGGIMNYIEDMFEVNSIPNEEFNDDFFHHATEEQEEKAP